MSHQAASCLAVMAVGAGARAAVAEVAPRISIRPACYTSCLDAHAKGQLSSGVYELCASASVSNKLEKVYCDQDTNGGGWMLLLTQTDAKDQYAGSHNPLSMVWRFG